MRMVNGVVFIEDIKGISVPSRTHIPFVDNDGTNVMMSTKNIVRLYELLRFEIEDRQGKDFTAYTKELFE